MKYRFKNWKKYQHYKNRNPPWIKLHFELLASPDWVMLDDASRVLAIASMLIASRDMGCIPANPEYMKRVAYLKSCNFKPLLDCGLLEPLADASDCLQPLADARPEVETETETEAEKKQPTLLATSLADDGFDKFWKAYPKKESKKDALKAWNQAKDKPDVDTIIDKINELSCSVKWTKDNGQFIPKPATWIRGGGWDDEPGDPADNYNPSPEQIALVMSMDTKPDDEVPPDLDGKD